LLAAAGLLGLFLTALYALYRYTDRAEPDHEGATIAYADELHHVADHEPVDEWTTDVEIWLRDHTELKRIGDQVLAVFNHNVDRAVAQFLRRGGIDPVGWAAVDGWDGVRELAGVN
jgi:hypothetical protein